ncbi:hypothetical protein ASPWEDRAFT_43656 [Aspergillus wentii DTO 134E9]|uniref:SH3 domain-containing protein n=1 Tax=Aspergillus wentii DTO 134E9 TaxID=1073089 RepID=A0A1L9R7B8_ASPWE|nr:uncharacterized protein ASPWEDRAFT_31490 [Aspergillus wentii DTO 134E9]XP_040685380.1 uncharacterized protein ASPWEDRAFT_43656 [Aspergillus wentii DTO 134E9]OJJ30778.1 hypothetical protein ASPWEDRAFT_31490 [Aspergillus wentii DTO 134E9]OJJ31703.1 hypothetical protein ASPWEDRAFT_43656 [Aspergillus wentii DTO 134E9]
MMRHRHGAIHYGGPSARGNAVAPRGAAGSAAADVQNLNAGYNNAGTQGPTGAGNEYGYVGDGRSGNDYGSYHAGQSQQDSDASAKETDTAEGSSQQNGSSQKSSTDGSVAQGQTQQSPELAQSQGETQGQVGANSQTQGQSQPQNAQNAQNAQSQQGSASTKGQYQSDQAQAGSGYYNAYSNQQASQKDASNAASNGYSQSKQPQANEQSQQSPQNVQTTKQNSQQNPQQSNNHSSNNPLYHAPQQNTPKEPVYSDYKNGQYRPQLYNNPPHNSPLPDPSIASSAATDHPTHTAATGIATHTALPTESNPTTMPTLASGSGGHKMGAGETAAAAASVVVVVGGIAGFILVWLHRKNRQRRALYGPKYGMEKRVPVSPKAPKVAKALKIGKSPKPPKEPKPPKAPKPPKEPKEPQGPSFVQRGASTVGSAMAGAALTVITMFKLLRKPKGSSPYPQVIMHHNNTTEMLNETFNNESKWSFPQLSINPGKSPNLISNCSTPTLIVSPTSESFARDGGRLRHVPSGRADRVDHPGTAEASTGSLRSYRPAPSEAEVDHASRPESPNVGSSASSTYDFTASRGDLLAITSITPSLANLYRVDMSFTPTKPGHIELREGQSVRIQQSYDNGWVLCSLSDKSQEGIAPRACLSSWPIRVQGTSLREVPRDGAPSPDAGSSPGTPRFYSQFFSTSTTNL